MTNEMISAKMELKELVDVFSNLADVKDAAAQGELFTEDGVYFDRGRAEQFAAPNRLILDEGEEIELLPSQKKEP